MDITVISKVIIDKPKRKYIAVCFKGELKFQKRKRPHTTHMLTVLRTLKSTPRTAKPSGYFRPSETLAYFALRCTKCN